MMATPRLPPQRTNINNYYSLNDRSSCGGAGFNHDHQNIHQLQIRRFGDGDGNTFANNINSSSPRQLHQRSFSMPYTIAIITPRQNHNCKAMASSETPKSYRQYNPNRYSSSYFDHMNDPAVRLKAILGVHDGGGSDCEAFRDINNTARTINTDIIVVGTKSLHRLLMPEHLIVVK